MNRHLGIVLLLAVVLTAGCEKKRTDAPDHPVFGQFSQPREPLAQSASWLMLVADQSPQTVKPDDGSIMREVTAALAADPMLNNSAIRVDSNGGIVTLSGAVESLTAVQRAGAIALNVKGVVSVDNKLSLMVSL